MPGSHDSFDRPLSGTLQVIARRLTGGFVARTDETLRLLLQHFGRAIEVGYFFPGTVTMSLVERATVDPALLTWEIEVNDLPSSCLRVLAGLFEANSADLADSYEILLSWEQGRASLAAASRLPYPAPYPLPAFEVDLAESIAAYPALLIAVEFRQPMETDMYSGLFDEISLWDVLCSAYPVTGEGRGLYRAVAEEPHTRFNDPWTLFHALDTWEAKRESFSLLVNLCCSWSQRYSVTRLTVE